MKIYNLEYDEDVRLLLNIRKTIVEHLSDVFEVEIDRDVYRCIISEYKNFNYILFNIYSQRDGKQLFKLIFNDFTSDLSKIFVKNVEYLDRDLSAIKYSSLSDNIIDKIFYTINRLQSSLEV